MTYFVSFGPLAKEVRSVCQKCFIWALRILLEKNGISFKNCSFFHVFRTWIKHLLNFWQKKFGRVADFPLDEPRGIFWGQQLFQRKKFLLFSYFEPKTFKKFQKLMTALSWRHISCPQEHFSELSSEVHWTILSLSDFLGEKCAFFKTAFHHPRGPSCKKSLFQLKTPFSIFFRTCSRKFRTVGIIILAGLPILHSISPEELSEDNKTSKREFFLSLSDFERKTLVRWQKNFGCLL